MSDMVLTGPDGTNPLGFLCAVGLLRVLHGRVPGQPRPSWREAEGCWRPVLHLPEGHPDPVQAVLEDLSSWRDVDPPELTFPPDLRDLKVPPEAFRQSARTASERAERDRRHADFLAAYASDVVLDRARRNTKSTALHFTAGQQKFLGIVSRLAHGVGDDHLREALYGPWQRQDRLGVLRWGPAGERLQALMATDPSKEEPPGVPGAEWLAFQALPLFPCFPVSRSRLATTGFAGGDDALVWPLWSVPITVATLRSLLSDPRLMNADLAWQEARGVACVLRATVRRSTKGYGTFGAAELVVGAFRGASRS